MAGMVSNDESKFVSTADSNTAAKSSQSVENERDASTMGLSLSQSATPGTFGDYKCGSDQTPVVHIKTKATSSESESVISSPFDHNGCGDFATPATTFSKHKNSLAAAASGDCGVGDCSKLSVVQEAASESCDAAVQPNNDAVKELQAPLSAHDCNKLRNMSSDHQKQLSEMDCETKKAVSTETPMNIRDINRLKVMSSEYHLRLSCVGKSDSVPSSEEHDKTRVLSEFERNRLKVMSSEYHVRLRDSLIPRPEKAESDSGPARLSERDLNKLKVMTSEYHTRLAASPFVEKSEISRPIEASEVVSADADISATLVCENPRDKTEEPESISEEVESEDPVTVIENSDRSPSPPSEEIRSDQKSAPNLFVLESYVTYGDQNFSCFSNGTFENLRTAADSVCDVNRSSLLYFLSQSIVIPLRIQSKIVNEAILRVFIEEEGYLQHLTTLRNYMFLRKPEFSLLLTNTVFKMAEKVKSPYLLLNNYTLSCILQQALLAANSKASIVFERKLCLSVEGTAPEAFDLADIKVRRFFALTFGPKTPRAGIGSPMAYEHFFLK